MLTGVTAVPYPETWCVSPAGMDAGMDTALINYLILSVLLFIQICLIIDNFTGMVHNLQKKLIPTMALPPKIIIEQNIVFFIANLVNQVGQKITSNQYSKDSKLKRF